MSNRSGSEKVIILGSVTRAHGLKGIIRVRSFADSPQSFEGLGRVLLRPKEGPDRWIRVEWIGPHPRGVLLKLKGVDNPESAELLVGMEVGVERSALPELDPGEFLWADLIGLWVVTGSGRRVGRVAALFQTGANDVLVVRGDAGEVLIPAVEAAVARVDLESGEIVLTEMEGLLPEEWEGTDGGEKTG